MNEILPDDIGVDRELSFSSLDRHQYRRLRNYMDTIHWHLFNFSSGVIEFMTITMNLTVSTKMVSLKSKESRFFNDTTRVTLLSINGVEWRRRSMNTWSKHCHESALYCSVCDDIGVVGKLSNSTLKWHQNPRKRNNVGPIYGRAYSTTSSLNAIHGQQNQSLMSSSLNILTWALEGTWTKIAGNANKLRMNHKENYVYHI